MLEFRKIDISDKGWINELLRLSDFRGCEYSFANNMAWQRLSNSVITRYKNFYISGSFEDNSPYFSYPSGEGDIEELIFQLKQITDSIGSSLVISSVNRENLAVLKEIYGDKIAVTENPDYFDYIYNAADLIEIKGKKFHGKRNHIARFKENNWEFCEITKDMFDDCISFSVKSYNESKGYDNYSAVCEQYAINTFFTYFDELRLNGGVLKVNGEMVGFTIGEKLNSDTFVVHIEKALSSIQGAYPTLCNEFAKKYACGSKYINREEDLGIEGLRKSKQSYHPAFLLEKYTVHFK